MANEEKDEKIIIEKKGEGKEVFPETERGGKTLEEVLLKGEQGVKTKEADINQEIKEMKKTAKTHELDLDECKKVDTVKEGLEQGVASAKNKYKQEIEPLKNNSGKIEQYNKNLDEIIKKIDQEKNSIEELKKSLQKMERIDDSKRTEQEKDKIWILKGGIQTHEIKLADLEKRKNKIEGFIREEKGETEIIEKKDVGMKPVEHNLSQKEQIMPVAEKNISKTEETIVLVAREKEQTESKTEADILKEEIKEIVNSNNLSAEEKKEKMETLSSHFVDLIDKELINKDEKKAVLNFIRDAENGIKADKNFSDSAKEFERSYEGLVAGGRNPNIPNYLDRRVREIEGMINEMRKDKMIDNKTVRFLQEAAKKDIDDMINSMTGEVSIAELYKNEFDKSDIKREEVSEARLKSCIENIKNKIYKIREVGNRWLKIDDEITGIALKMDTSLYSEEQLKAHKFLDEAANTKNIAEQQVYLLLATNIIDNIEKGLKNEKMKNALMKS